MGLQEQCRTPCLLLQRTVNTADAHQPCAEVALDHHIAVQSLACWKVVLHSSLQAVVHASSEHRGHALHYKPTHAPTGVKLMRADGSVMYTEESNTITPLTIPLRMADCARGQ